jgi:hypothetical protein
LQVRFVAIIFSQTHTNTFKPNLTTFITMTSFKEIGTGSFFSVSSTYLSSSRGVYEA